MCVYNFSVSTVTRGVYDLGDLTYDHVLLATCFSSSRTLLADDELKHLKHSSLLVIADTRDADELWVMISLLFSQSCDQYLAFDVT